MRFSALKLGPAMKPFTKRLLRQALGVETDASLAKFFRVSASAVSQWPEDGPIPEIRQLQLEKWRPDLFIEGQSPQPPDFEAA